MAETGRKQLDIETENTMKQTCETCVYWTLDHPFLKDYGTCLAPVPFWVEKEGEEITYKLSGGASCDCYVEDNEGQN